MCQETELHLEGGLDHVVGSVDGLGSSETCSSELSIIKNRYLDTKISLLRCLGAELHLQVALDHVVGVHQFWNLFESTQHGEKHISGHQDQPSTKPGI